MLAPWKKSYDQPRQHIKKQGYHFANKGLSSQNYGFSSDHVQPKNWCFQTVMLEKTLENPLDSKEIKPVNPNGNQPWIFIGRTDPEAEAPIIWPPDVKSWLTGKDPDAEKDWRQEEKWATEDEIVGWHHWLSGHEFEQTLDGDGQGSLACYCPRSHKKSDTTEQPNSWQIPNNCCCCLIPKSFVIPRAAAHQAPLSMGFSRQEFPSPGDLSEPGTEPESPALAGRFFTTEPPGKLTH